MDDRDHSLPQDQIDRLYQVARLAGIYYQALIKQGLSDELAARLVQDWHLHGLDTERNRVRRFWADQSRIVS